MTVDEYGNPMIRFDALTGDTTDTADPVEARIFRDGIVLIRTGSGFGLLTRSQAQALARWLADTVGIADREAGPHA